MNLEMIKKHMNVLFWMGMISMFLTFTFKIVKIVFVSIYYPEWQNILWTVIPAIIIIALKIIKGIPKEKQLNKLRKDHKNHDVSIIRKIYKINLIFVIIFAVNLASELTKYRAESAHTAFPSTVNYIFLLMTVTMLIAESINMIYAKKLCNHFYPRQNR